MLPDEQASPEQLAILRGMTGQRRLRLAEEPIWLAPPEYVIVRKLEYFREGGSEKHLRDIRSMLVVSGESLDRTLLLDWIARRGLQAEWQSISR